MLRALLRLAVFGGRREGASALRPCRAPADGRRRAAPDAARASPRCTRSRSGLTDSTVPDILAPGVRVVFCGINPGHWSAREGAAFANPRNDFWRLLHAAGFTPRVLAPHEQGELLRYGIGLTNAARRTTRGSGDLRAADFAGARERLEEIASTLAPRRSPSSARPPTRERFASAPRTACRSRGSDRPRSSCFRRRRLRTPPSRGRSGCGGSGRSRSSSNERPGLQHAVRRVEVSQSSGS